MLWAENYNSVNYRYDEDETPPVYSAETTEALFDPVVIYKAAGCYEYQSCEHPEWADSEANALISALAVAAEDRMPAADQAANAAQRRYWSQPRGIEPPWPAYDAAPWGIERIEEAFAHVKR